MNKKFLSKWLFLNIKPEWDSKIFNYSYLSVRLLTGLIMLFSHGVGKLLGFSKIAPHFPDPLGLGPTLSLLLVTGAEFFGAILLALGLLTRWASFSLLFTMLVAAFVTHWADPFAKKELAVLYALLFLLFTLAGGGKYSLDNVLKKKIKL